MMAGEVARADEAVGGRGSGTSLVAVVRAGRADDGRGHAPVVQHVGTDLFVELGHEDLNQILAE